MTSNRLTGATSDDHPVTYSAADSINVYDHLAWYCDVSRRIACRTSRDPRDHLEELARLAVSVHLLDGWQAINIHQAVLTGATLDQLCAALGEPAADVVRRWTDWSTGQRHLWQTWTAEDPGRTSALSFDPAEHGLVAETLAAQLNHNSR